MEKNGAGQLLLRKEAASDFLRLAATGDVRRAFANYASSNFRHHNPHFRGDAESLATAMEENAAQNPDKLLEIKSVIGEGDLVMVFSRVRLRPDTGDIALVHIFRFEGDRVAELWDIGQPVPEESANEHGMF